MNSKISILLADDDALEFAPKLNGFLQSEYKDFKLDTATTPGDTMKLVRENKYQFILLDISFHKGDYSGLVLAPKIKSASPDSSVIMMSSRDDLDTVMRCRSLGAIDFLSKLNSPMESVVQHIKSHKETALLRAKDFQEGEEIAKTLGRKHVSYAMKEAYAQVAQARRSPTSGVLIYGETGTGKEAIAQAINMEGKPFVGVDCGAITESLAESAFFGHTKGSFTGAEYSNRGYLVSAHGGDIFLDEIGNLKPAIQEKLLRALQNKKVTPIGGTPVSFEARIISATNDDLDILSETGNFRRDLLERIKGITIRLPPLRERMEDFEGIAETILSESKISGVSISENCMPFLKTYSWPGNIRELKRTLLQMVDRSRGPLLSIDSLPAEFHRNFERDYEKSRAEKSIMHISTVIPSDSDLKSASEIFKGTFIDMKAKSLNLSPRSQGLADALGVARSTLYKVNADSTETDE